MGKNVIVADVGSSAGKEKKQLQLELAEIKQISELLFAKLEKKIKVVEALGTSIDAKIAALEQLDQRAQADNAPAFAEQTASMEKKIAALHQMLQQSEASQAKTLASLGTAMNDKATAIGRSVQQADALEKKLSTLQALEAAIDKRTAQLEQTMQRAAGLEKRLQDVEALEVTIDKKMGALELLARRAETVRSNFGGTNRQHEIFSLKRKGLSSGEIAEALEMPHGEVDLTLELYAENA